MPIATDLVAKYTNTISGAVRTLDITAQDTTARTISGTWHSTINQVAVDFPVTGIYVPAESNGSSGLYFAVQGAAQVSNVNWQPAILRAIETVTGYAEVSGPGKVDRLFITIAWSEDLSGFAKETSAWTGLYLDRT